MYTSSLRTGRTPSRSGSSDRLVSQSAYQEAQSLSSPSTIRYTTWWVSPASWSRSLICPVACVIGFPSRRSRDALVLHVLRSGLLLGEDLVAQADALRADIHPRAGDQPQPRHLRLAAERAPPAACLAPPAPPRPRLRGGARRPGLPPHETLPRGLL